MVLELPKLERMSLRTMPLAVNTFETLPFAELVPSLG